MKAISILANWVLSAIAIIITANFVPGFNVDSFQTALIVALILGIFNAIVKPIITILTLPITILTLGLFGFVINAFMLLAVDYFVAGFQITNFVTALLAAILLWLINILIDAIFTK